MRSTGFTLVELVVVILLLGVLGAYVAPRFLARSNFDALVARQDLKQALRLAQQLAMSRTDTNVVFTSVASAMAITAGGVSLPTFPLTLPAGITLDAATITFNHLGGTGGGDVALRVLGGEQVLRVCVEGATGYVHDC